MRRSLLLLFILLACPTLGEAALIITPPGVTCANDPRLQTPVQGQDYCYQSTDQTARTWNGITWVNMDTGGGGTLTGSGVAGQVGFWTAAEALGGDAALTWSTTPPGPSASGKSLLVGTVPLGTLAQGHAYFGLLGPANSTGMQTLMVQTYQGAAGLAGLVTLGNDRVGVSSWNFRGTGATNPIYGANFGVVFNTNGVANGLEIDVQNMTGTPVQGQALWLNGSGASGRANAILIDTQDGSKWDRGILFKEGFVGGGATGSISGMGIHFEQSQDADFIVIQPRLGVASEVAFKITDPAFTFNMLAIQNNGILLSRGASTTAAFPNYSFTDDNTKGMYSEATDVLGFAVDSLRRVTIDASLNVWNSGAGANQGGSLKLFDNTAVHSVGFLAADTINNSFRIRLPAAPGTVGQCVISDGASPIETWSYSSSCGGGGGAGTVTNTGALTASALVVGNGGVDAKVLASLGTTTTVLHGNAAGLPTFGAVALTTDVSGVLPVANGGTGVATFTANGVLYGNAATSVLVTAQGAANTVLTANAGAPVFSSSPTVASVTTTAQGALVVGPFGTSSGETGEVRFLERLANGTNYVGFRAPDSLAGNVIWTLPSTDSTGTQCLASNGSAVLSWGACSAGSGTGLTSLNGLTGSTQTFTNDTNVTITSGGTAHVLGWAGTLSSTRGGLGLNTSGSTGVPTVAAGTWTVAAQLTPTRGGTGLDTSAVTGVPTITTGTWTTTAQLPTSFGGTGSPGGTVGRIPFWDTAVLSETNVTWNSAGNLLQVGTGSTGTPSSGNLVLTVTGNPPATVPVTRLEATTSTTTTTRTALALVRTTAAAQMADGFGIRQDFILRDQDAVDNVVARLLATRSGLDTTGIFTIQTAIGGTLADRFVINEVGQAKYVATPTVGTFQLAANSTRRVELQFFTNSNTNAVSLIAPATATGNHVWTLPTTMGAAGSVLTNSDGAGTLTWGTTGGAVTTTGSPANTQFAFFTGPTSISSNANFSFNSGTGVVSLLAPGSLLIGIAPAGGQAPGPAQVALINSDNSNPYQAILGQIINGSSAGAVPVTVANDKVAIAGDAFRGAGGSSPIYGGHFGVLFSTTGVANAVELGVTNNSGTNTLGNGLWVNGNGTNHRDNAILIDTQNNSKWTAGIRFKEGDTGGGATGSILSYGIIFDKSHDADFLVIRPRVGAGNNAIRITDSTFATNQFIITNDGNMALGGAAIFGGSGSINTNGNINTASNMGANQYFSNGTAGFGTPGTGTTKVAGACTFTIAGGIITNVTGC